MTLSTHIWGNMKIISTEILFTWFYINVVNSNCFCCFTLLPLESQLLSFPVNVHTHGSEFLWGVALSSLLFGSLKHCLESGICLLLCIRNTYKWGPCSPKPECLLLPMAQRSCDSDAMYMLPSHHSYIMQKQVMRGGVADHSLNYKSL